jgi:hypothetical protein
MFWAKFAKKVGILDGVVASNSEDCLTGTLLEGICSDAKPNFQRWTRTSFGFAVYVETISE